MTHFSTDYAKVRKTHQSDLSDSDESDEATTISLQPSYTPRLKTSESRLFPVAPNALPDYFKAIKKRTRTVN